MRINFANGLTLIYEQGVEQSYLYDVISFVQAWDNSSPYIVAHTSGSTGLPKRIELFKRDMVASAKLTNHYFGLSSHSRLLLALSPSYIAGKMMIVRAIVARCTLVVVEPKSNPFLLHQPTQIDLCALVPMQVEAIHSCERSRSVLNQMRAVIIGGAALLPTLVAELQQVKPPCFLTYGMTETVSHIALKLINGESPPSLYIAMSGVTFEQDSRGCLVINAPHFTQQRFCTNDIVVLHSATAFDWVGRYDHVVNSGGVKMSPEVLEQKLSGIISTRYYITSMFHRKLGEKLVLVVEGKRWSERELRVFSQYVSQLLTPYERPKVILFRDKLAETSTRKLIKRLVV